MTPAEQQELNCWIAEHVFGEVVRNGRIVRTTTRLQNIATGRTKEVEHSFEVDHYTTDHAAAMEVLKKCADSVQVRITTTHDKKFCVECYQGSKHHIYVEAETIELAICLFAKKLFSNAK